MWLHHQRGGNQGSILIDILVATGILTASLLVIFTSLIATTDGVIRNREQAEAVDRLQNDLEQIRASSFATLVDGTTTQSIPTLPGGTETITVTTQQNDLKRVTLTLQWDSHGQRSVSLVTQIAKAGLEAL